MPPALFLGQGVHHALDIYYATAPHDINGALVEFRDWARGRADAMKDYVGTLWAGQRDMINEMHTLGHNMLRHYDMWASQLDGVYEVVATESQFSLPVPVPEGCPVPTTRSGEVIDMTIAGRFDGIVRNKNTGEQLLLEFKTASNFGYAPYTMRSLQTGVYLWAAKQIYGEVDGMLYRFMLKKIPDDPKWLESSTRPSKAKSPKQTAEWTRDYLRRWAEQVGLDVKAVLAEYADLLIALAEQPNAFFMERMIHRTPVQLEDIVKAVFEQGRLMADPDVPIFEHGGFHCSYCSFADPCTLREHGMDFEALLAAEYNTRDYWEDTEN
jgi:hypothetical protein